MLERCPTCSPGLRVCPAGIRRSRACPRRSWRERPRSTTSTPSMLGSAPLPSPPRTTSAAPATADDGRRAVSAPSQRRRPVGAPFRSCKGVVLAGTVANSRRCAVKVGFVPAVRKCERRSATARDGGPGDRGSRVRVDLGRGRTWCCSTTTTEVPGRADVAFPPEARWPLGSFPGRSRTSPRRHRAGPPLGPACSLVPQRNPVYTAKQVVVPRRAVGWPGRLRCRGRLVARGVRGAPGAVRAPR